MVYHLSPPIKMGVPGGKPWLLSSLLCPHCWKITEWLRVRAWHAGTQACPRCPLSVCPQSKLARGWAPVATSTPAGSLCREIWHRLLFLPLRQLHTELVVDSPVSLPRSLYPHLTTTIARLGPQAALQLPLGPFRSSFPNPSSSTTSTLPSAVILDKGPRITLLLKGTKQGPCPPRPPTGLARSHPTTSLLTPDVSLGNFYICSLHPEGPSFLQLPLSIFKTPLPIPPQLSPLTSHSPRLWRSTVSDVIMVGFSGAGHTF